MSTITPNMSLEKPDVSSEPGPAWATMLNAALDLIDAHDHASGKGTKVTQAGINITGSLEMNNQKLTEALAIVFQQQGSNPSDVNTIFAKSDGELYYKDGSGNVVQLTIGGRISGIITTLLLHGAFTMFAPVTVTATPYNMPANDFVILVDTSAVTITINLFAAATPRLLFIKDKTGSAATRNITIDASGGELIDGALTRVISTNFGCVLLCSHGSAWSVLSAS